jgi:U3 small nucleolar RNA-associated protein 10
MFQSDHFSSEDFGCFLCSPNLVLLSVITATLKIVESLPHFLSPYLNKLLLEVSIQSAKWQNNTDDAKTMPVLHKLKAIR